MPKRIAIIVVLLLAVTAPARAGSITLYGMDLEITNVGLVDPSVTDGAYLFQLTLDTTGYVAPDASLIYGTDWLTAIAIDFGTTITTASLDAQTSESGWAITTGHATQSGCANGPNDWTCLQTGSTLLPLDGSTYSWFFTLDFLDDAAYSPDTTASLEGVVSGRRYKPNRSTLTKNYVSPGTAIQIGYTPPALGGDPTGAGGSQDPTGAGGSEDSGPISAVVVPEPGTLALVLTGLLAVRRRRAN